MDLSTQRRCLTALAGVLLVGAVGAVVWSLSNFETPVVATSNGLRPEVSDSGASPATAEIEFDPSIAGRQLRGPLVPPPAVRPPAPKPAPKPVVRPRTPPPPPRQKLQLTLIGTIIKSDRSVAIISDASGKYDTKAVGETLELTPAGVTVEDISSDEVTLQYNGSSSTFRLDKSAKGVGKAAIRRNNNNRNRGR